MTQVSEHLQIDVDRAIERGRTVWHPDSSHVDHETAYWDRTLLGSEVERLREELAATRDALDEAEREVEELQHVLLETHPD